MICRESPQPWRQFGRMAVMVFLQTVSMSAFAACGNGLLAQYWNYGGPFPPAGFPASPAVLTRVDSTINLSTPGQAWGATSSGTSNNAVSPGPGIGGTDFMAKWTGSVQASQTGDYTFYINVDDGGRLLLSSSPANSCTSPGSGLTEIIGVVGSPYWLSTQNGVFPPQPPSGTCTVNDCAWTPEPAVIYATATTIHLTAGQYYNIEMDYFQAPGYDIAQLGWSCTDCASPIPIQVIPQSQLSTAVPAPQLTGISIAPCAPSYVLVNFNLAMDPVTSQNAANYSLSGPGAPAVQSATLVNPTTVRVAFSGTMTGGQSYTLTVSNVQSTLDTTISPNPSSASFTAVSGNWVQSPNNAEGDVGGLLGTYYDQNGQPGAYFTGNTATEVDGPIDFDNSGNNFCLVGAPGNCGNGVPTPVGGPDNFSVNWSGAVKVNTAGTYTFYITVDDGGRLFIDGQQIIAVGGGPNCPVGSSDCAWILQGATGNPDNSSGIPDWKSAPITLSAGYHTIMFQYFQGPGSTTAVLQWNGPDSGNAPALIPSNQLYYCGAGVISSFVVSAPANGDPCSPIPVTITALDGNGNVLTGYTGTPTIVTSTDNSTGNTAWGPGSPAPNGVLTTPLNGDPAAAAYQYATADQGVVNLTFNDGGADSGASIQILVTDYTTGASGVSGVITYPAGDYFSIIPYLNSLTSDPVNTVVAGKPYDFQATLMNRNCSGPVTNYGGKKGNPRTLQASITPDPANPGGNTPAYPPAIVDMSGKYPSSGPLPTAPATTPVTLYFGGKSSGNPPPPGSAYFTLNTTDVGKYSINLADNRYGPCTRQTCTGSSPVLTVRPFALVVTNITNAGGTANPGNNTPTGAVFTGAGQNFSATVTGVLWQSADDSNNDGVPDDYTRLAATPVTPSYAWTTLLAPCPNTTRMGASGPYCAFTPAPPAGTLGTLANGSVAQSAFSGGSGTATTLQYSDVGSFMLSAAAGNFLNSPGVDAVGYSGVIGRFIPDHFDVTGFLDGCNVNPGVDFTYSGQPFALVQVTARNAQGNTTVNYSSAAGYSKTVTIVDTSGAAGSFIAGTIPASAFTAPGVGSSSTITYQFTAKETAPATLQLAATDTDVGIPPPASSGRQSAPVESGRVHLLGAVGSELLDLPLPLYLESFQGADNGWQVNANDTCTTLATSDFSLSYLPGGLPGGTTSVKGVSLTNGQGSVTLAAPGAGNTGDVDVAGSGIPAWLQFDWQTSGTLADPAARASFGVYQGDSHQIYIQVIH